jgi:hypothetical protein
LDKHFSWVSFTMRTHSLIEMKYRSENVIHNCKGSPNWIFGLTNQTRIKWSPINSIRCAVQTVRTKYKLIRLKNYDLVSSRIFSTELILPCISGSTFQALEIVKCFSTCMHSYKKDLQLFLQIFFPKKIILNIISETKYFLFI